MKEKNAAIILPPERIENKILLIRDKKVILDRDLAELYGVETRILNQAVKRNIKRFPNDFMFSLSRVEIMMISQFVISLKFSKNVFAFTEQGVAMLSSVLNSDRAIQINIQIMRAFTKLREVLATHKDLQRKIEGHDNQIKYIFKILNRILTPPTKPKRKIGFLS